MKSRVSMYEMTRWDTSLNQGMSSRAIDYEDFNGRERPCLLSSIRPCERRHLASNLLGRDRQQTGCGVWILCFERASGGWGVQ